MTPATPIQNRQGFTLVELMVSILIMVVGILATLSLISVSMKANTHANQLTTKTALAQQIMEDLLSRDKSSLDIPATNVVYDLNIPDTATTDLPASGAGTYHATYTTAWATTTLVQISITVSSVPDDGLSLQCSAYRYLVE